MQHARTIEVWLVCLGIVLTAACESAERRNFREGLEAREASLIERRDLATSFAADLAAELQEHGASEHAGCPELEELPGIDTGGFSAWGAEARARVQRERDAQAQARREAFERNLPAERCLCLQGTLAAVRAWIDADIEEEIATQQDLLDGWSQTELEAAIMLTGVPRPVSMDSVREAIEDWRARRHEDWTGETRTRSGATTARPSGGTTSAIARLLRHLHHPARGLC